MNRLLLLAVIPAGWAVGASCGADRVAPEVFPDLVIVTDTLPTAIRGQPYTEAVHAEGGDGDYAWNVTDGALPPGLAILVDDLGEDHAILTGVPESDGSFTFTVTVVSGDGQSASETFSVEVLPLVPLSIGTPAVPPALDGGPYDVRLVAYGGDGVTFEWELVAGTLPAGLELVPDGRIQGTPAGVDTAQFTVEVRSANEAVQNTYTLPVVAHRPGQYNITIFPVSGGVPASLIPHLEAAIAKWEAAVTGNLSAIHIPPDFFPAESCGGFGELINGTSTDDLLIIINIAPIDGPGGVLGRAGACGIRAANSLPFAGTVTLDSDDLLQMAGDEIATFIMAHEIAHVLGFGTLWDHMDLIEGEATADPRFVGPAAIEEYLALGGDTVAVPVENQGGEGTRDSHWRQVTFQNELMTGFSAPPGVFQPLSRVSIASIADLGYDVDMSQADSFTLPAAIAGDVAHDHPWQDIGYDEVLLEPIHVLDADGQRRTIQPR